MSAYARELVDYLERAASAIEATPEIGHRAAGAKYGFNPRSLASVINQAQPRTEVPYAAQPPDDLLELARQLGYSAKALGRRLERHGNALLGMMQTEWRQAQEIGHYLDQNPSRPPTTDPTRSAKEEGELVPHAAVLALPGTKAARERYQRQQERERAEWRALPPETRLRLVREEAQRNGIDLRRQFARIDQGIEAAASKVRRLSRNPSERAA